MYNDKIAFSVVMRNKKKYTDFILQIIFYPCNTFNDGTLGSYWFCRLLEWDFEILKMWKQTRRLQILLRRPSLVF